MSYELRRDDALDRMVVQVVNLVDKHQILKIKSKGRIPKMYTLLVDIE